MFDIFKVLDLTDLGENWKNCYLKFGVLTVGEIQKVAGLTADKDDVTKITETALGILEEKFLEGYAIKGGIRVAVKKDDLKEFPVDILTKAFEILAGGEIGKKKLNLSTTPSEGSEGQPPQTS